MGYNPSRMKRAVLASLVFLTLPACIFVPRTTAAYDAACRIEAKQMTIEVAQLGSFGGCQGKGCVELLVGAGAVAAASAVISGTIVVAGNIVYWLEKEGRCIVAPST